MCEMCVFVLFVLGLVTQTGAVFGGRCYVSYEETDNNFTGTTSTSECVCMHACVYVCTCSSVCVYVHYHTYTVHVYIFSLTAGCI